MTESIAIDFDTVYTLVRNVLVDLGVDGDEFHADAKFDDLDVDSLDIADLMTAIKKEYGIEIPRNELAGVTVRGFVDRVLGSAA
ncbi:phosphopantetheine-binding protein [Nocardia sp. CDC159]|uniref:Phosphopantetheine-binding protein n=1 Tax=Nocardia pulmonis TaxID=2951408 RepID=A0A9X2EA29_9NOCA|nr:MULTISPECIES: phosphopantetheine-binding protein [Nocardia]MCM6774313.1 phosphopantetheine-binding protein [Nocardia pulmonis]MCM6787621.1 phosphopantetheine-binding protein [Nocardia sp. CDC159]